MYERIRTGSDSTGRPTPMYARGRTWASLLAASVVLGAVGCTSLSYPEPDAAPTAAASPDASAAPAAPATAPPSAIRSPGDTTNMWAIHARNARAAQSMGDLETARDESLASLAATTAFTSGDVRRQTALGNLGQLALAYQRAGRLDEANSLLVSMLAEAQGGAPVPLGAWSWPLQNQFDSLLEADRLETAGALAESVADVAPTMPASATQAEIELRLSAGHVLLEGDRAALAHGQLDWVVAALEASRAPNAMKLLGALTDRAAAATAEGDIDQARSEWDEAILFTAASANPDASTTSAAPACASPTTLRAGLTALACAHACNDAAEFHLTTGDAAVALDLADAALLLVEDTGPLKPMRAAVLDTRAVALHRLGRLRDADLAFNQAMAARAASDEASRAALAVIETHHEALLRDLKAERSAGAATSSAAGGTTGGAAVR